MKLFLQLAIACVLIIHARAADGWEKVKWGMTMEQVREIYPEAMPSKGTSAEGGDRMIEGLLISPSMTLEIPRYDWEGLSFQVALIFLGEKGLSGCFMLAPHDYKNMNLDLRPQYQKVVKSLSETYGEAKEQDVPDTLFRKAEWTSGGTRIRSMLMLAKEPQLRTAISLTYTKPEAFKKP